MGTAFSSDEVNTVNSIMVHIPSPSNKTNDSDETRDEASRLRKEIEHLIDQIKSKEQDVNIVFSGPSCIGVAQFCDHFANNLTQRSFRMVDGNVLMSLENHKNSPRVAGWGQCFQRMESRRQKALDDFVIAEPKDKRSVVLHSTDLAKDTYVYKILTEIENEEMRWALRPPTPSQPMPVGRMKLGPKLRVFCQNPGDYSIAMAQASHKLGYIDQLELESLEVQGELCWAESSRVRSPSNTLYVYLQYDDKLYDQSYSACMEEAQKRGKEGTKLLRALEQLQSYSKTTKSCMDELYSSQDSDIVSKYFSVVFRFEALQLLSPLHELVVCREVLSYVHSLQLIQLWNGEDYKRLQYLGSADWTPLRVRNIPFNVTGTKQVQKHQTDKDFKNGSPPLPRAQWSKNNISTPALSPKRVQEIREDAGVPRSSSLPNISPTPATTTTTTTPPRATTSTPQSNTPVYGSGTIRRSTSVQRVVVVAGK